VICHICDQHVALHLITSIEAVLKTIAALQATITHGQCGSVVTSIFLGIFVAGVSQGFAAKAAQFILAHGTILVAIAKTLLIQSISTSASGLITAIGTIHDIVAPIGGGYALFVAIASNLIIFWTTVPLQRLLRHTRIGGIDDLTLMCSDSRLISMSHLEVGIGETRLTSRREITLDGLTLCLVLTLLILHVSAVDLLSIALFLR